MGEHFSLVVTFSKNWLRVISERQYLERISTKKTNLRQAIVERDESLILWDICYKRDGMKKVGAQLNQLKSTIVEPVYVSLLPIGRNLIELKNISFASAITRGSQFPFLRVRGHDSKYDSFFPLSM